MIRISSLKCSNNNNNNNSLNYQIQFLGHGFTVVTFYYMYITVYGSYPFTLLQRLGGVPKVVEILQDVRYKMAAK